VSGPIGGGADGSLVVVKTGGLSSYDRIYLEGSPLGAAVGYALIFFAILEPARKFIPYAAISYTVAVVGLFLYFENLWAIRGVRVSPGGVEFRYIFHRTAAPWADLSIGPGPQPYARQRQGVYFSRRYTKGETHGVWSHFVTREQARAILLHPSCPQWPLDRQVSAFLGLTPERGSSSVRVPT
jgi:hypothetical protein